MKARVRKEKLATRWNKCSGFSVGVEVTSLGAFWATGQAPSHMYSYICVPLHISSKSAPQPKYG